MRMIATMYFILLAYFLLGSIGLYLINRKKKPSEARKSLVKTITYFIAINIVFFSIVIDARAFRYLAVLISAAGFIELFKLFKESGFRMKTLYIFSTIAFAVFSVGFYDFSGMEKGLILFTFMILSIFDSFSQITGQLAGRNKIIPKISPQKTVEGFIGGFMVAIASGLLLRSLITAKPVGAMLMAAGVAVFAFIGDSAASYYKRIYDVKDFSNLIPGTGGFLDRFDSLIAGGAWISFLGLLIHA